MSRTISSLREGRKHIEVSDNKTDQLQIKIRVCSFQRNTLQSTGKGFFTQPQVNPENLCQKASKKRTNTHYLKCTM